MSLRTIYGHDALLNRLAGVVATGRFPQSALLVGPRGVGKQRLALWVAQGLVCAEGPGAPCGECRDCHQVRRLTHPDVHWFVPIERLTAAEASKQIEEAQEALGAALEERRTGLWRAPEGMMSHPLASVRVLQRVVSRKAFSGRRTVVILGDAERLVVQDANQEAANAILKVLEEPPQDTTVIVTAADAGALLPTIRSRLVTLRVAPVGDGAVRAFLEAELDPAPRGSALERRVILAGGSIGVALDSEKAVEPDSASAELLDALTRGRASWLPRALSQAPWEARGNFTGLLDGMAVEIRDRLSAAAAADPAATRKRIAALRLVENARSMAQGNVNPRLTLAVLASDLEALV